MMSPSYNQKHGKGAATQVTPVPPPSTSAASATAAIAATNTTAATAHRPCPPPLQGAARCKGWDSYRPKIESLSILKPLGAGGFARVLMVRDTCTRCMFALKIMNKKRLVSRNPVPRRTSPRLASTPFAPSFSLAALASPRRRAFAPRPCCTKSKHSTSYTTHSC